MSKMFYSLEEALAKLGCDEETLKNAVRDAKLREFRDAGAVNYKVDEVDKLAASGGIRPSAGPGGDSIRMSDTDNPMPDLSASGSIGLMDTGISLGGADVGKKGAAPGKSGTGGFDLGADLGGSTGGGDILSLDDDEAAGSQSGTATPKKDDTVVTSVGVSVFDDEEMEVSADPLAKTAMSGSGSGGMGLEGVGSGSGLLDLTRESDDTSLGAEFLEEIYPTEEGEEADEGAATAGGSGSAAMEMGEDTRAGLEMALPEAEEEEPSEAAAEADTAVAAAPRVSVDVFAAGTAGLMAVALATLCFAGLAIAAMIRGAWPSLLDLLYGRLWMFGVGAVVVAGVVMAVGVLLQKRSRS